MPTTTVEESNRAASRAEVEAFRLGAKGPYFAYWHKAKQGGYPYITTWMGDRLATVYWRGANYYCSAFGGWPSERVNFCAKGIDGREWYGTYYKSSGTYVRMRPCKVKE